MDTRDMKRAIDSAWAAIERAALSNFETDRMLNEAFTRALAWERLGRANGDKYRLTLRYTARYHVVRVVLQPLPAPESWLDAVTTPRHAAYASAVADLLRKLGITLLLPPDDAKRIAAIRYQGDIAPA